MRDISSVELMTLCVSLVQKEVQKRVSVYEDISEKYNNLDYITGIESQLRNQLEIMSESMITELPDGILYEVHLEDFKRETFNTFSEVKSNIEESSRSLYNLASNISTDLESKEESILSLLEDTSNKINSDILGAKESIDALELKHSSELKELFDGSIEIRSLIDASSNLLNDTIHNLSSDMLSMIAEINSEISSIKSSHKEFSDITLSSISDIRSLLKSEVSSLNSKIKTSEKARDKIISRVDRDIKSVQRSLDKSDTQKSKDIEKLRKYSDKTFSKSNHKHDIYAEKDEVSELLKELELQKKAIELHTNRLSEIYDKISTKVEKKDALTLKDLEPVKSAIQKSVESNIKMPADGKNGEDGKDAFNWEFKFQSPESGILMYKREDEEVWKRQNLMGPRGIRGMPGSAMGAAFIGGSAVSDTRVFNDTVSLQEGFEFILTHNLNLDNQNAFTINLMHNNSQVTARVTSIDKDTISILSFDDLEDVYVTIIGAR